jgi:hypothetical protein
MDLQEDFYKKVEDVGYLNHVLYSDTDSIYIIIPVDIKNMSMDKKLDLAKKVSVDINNDIQEYLFENYFKRSNTSIDHNMTDFKTEVIMDSIMFIPNVKKQYAFKMIAEGNKIFEEPKTEYKGIQVVRSDATELGKKLLREFIEKVILNSEIKKKDKFSHIVDIVNKTHEKFLKLCEEFTFADLAPSVKWGKDQTVINSMKLYNHISGENTFLPASAGRFVYCKFTSLNKFSSLGIDTSKINAVTIPYRYTPEILKEKFKEFGISIDMEKQWTRVYTTTVQRIVDLVKGETKN